MARATSGEGGKTDDRRPTNQKSYDWNYIRSCGEKCPKCKSKNKNCEFCQGKKIHDPKKYYQLGGV